MAKGGMGASDGFSDGLSDGLSDGFSDAFSDGWSDGLSDGFSDGLSDGFSDGFSDGYSDGYSDGLSDGHGDGGRRRGRSGGRRWLPGAGGGDVPGGRGFAGGYGRIARAGFATPAEFGFKPWSADFLVVGGEKAFPVDHRINPWSLKPHLEWRTDDWDPMLRFWSLPFDPNLTEWLQTTNLAAPNVMVAREFAALHANWQFDPGGPDNEARLLQQIENLVARAWLIDDDVKWWGWQGMGKARDVPAAGPVVMAELEALAKDMQDSRNSYLAEARGQAAEMRAYFVHAFGIHLRGKPWTAHLMRCATAIAHIAYMYFKGRFKRVRPSRLCAGLAPPFGPPQHPAFPSGHSLAAHMIALLLLRLPGFVESYGVLPTSAGAREIPTADDLRKPIPPTCPPLWLAARIAKNRERIGVHYRSDSSAGRNLAIGIWESIRTRKIVLPTLERVIARAAAEWQR